MISEEYREEQRKLHESPNYGTASVGYAPIVSQVINQTGFTELLDYGAGKGRLAKSLSVNHEVKVTHYEPSNPEWADAPDSHQMVACIDVLEHVEPTHINAVLDDLQRVTELVGFFSIHTGPAMKTLSDGRNAHLIQAPASWWLPKIMERFDLIQFHAQQHGFYVVVKNANQ